MNTSPPTVPNRKLDQAPSIIVGVTTIPIGVKKLAFVAMASALLFACKPPSLSQSVDTPIQGGVWVWHLDGTKSEFQVTLQQSKPTFVAISEGVRLRIETMPDEVARERFSEPDFRFFSQSLELKGKLWTKRTPLGHSGMHKSRNYRYELCEILYTNDPRWRVDRPLAGTVPGEARFLCVKEGGELSELKTVHFVLDLSKADFIALDESYSIEVKSRWTSSGFVQFEYRLDRKEPDGKLEHLVPPSFTALPGWFVIDILTVDCGFKTPSSEVSR